MGIRRVFRTENNDVDTKDKHRKQDDNINRCQSQTGHPDESMKKIVKWHGTEGEGIEGGL